MDIANTIMMSMALLAIAMVAASLLQNSSMPFTVLLVIIGIVLAQLSQQVPWLGELRNFKLTPDLVFFIFLPALIFESGLNLNARQLMKDIAPVLTLAVPAMLISTSLIGLAIAALLDMDLVIALLFGALISATDPVAVVALFKELGAPLRLNILVEGESLFNDATAIVVFGILLAMVTSDTSISFSDLGGATVQFLTVFLGGTVVGVLLGLFASELIYRLKCQTSAILAMSLVTAYCSFIIAEHHFHVSGVMATVGAAMALGIYGLNRIPLNSKPIVSETWEFIAMVANSLLFLLVGLSIDPSVLMDHSTAIAIAVFCVIAARAVSVYTMVPLTVWLFKLPAVSRAEQHIMWWGGLKGGLAIAIALSIPESIPSRELILSITLGVVLFTLLVNAWSIRPLMHLLRLDVLNEDEQAELERELTHAEARSGNLLEQYRALGILSHRLGERLDYKMRELFKNDLSNHNPRQARRRVFLFTLKTEIDALNQLYNTGIIDQYTLMDLRNNVQIDREAFARYETTTELLQRQLPPSILQRFERWVLKLLREKNWAVGALASFQSNRLERNIQHNVAEIVMANLVIEHLHSDKKLDRHEKDIMIKLQQQRLAHCNQQLATLREEFEDMFASVESHMFTRAALIAAKIDIDAEFMHGEIGVKAYNRMSQLIGHILQQTSTPRGNLRESLHPHLQQVKLFANLSHHAINILSEHVHEVTFLPEDVIIGEGDHGDALYIVKSGDAIVTKMIEGQSKEVLRYHAGDFFGEIALLGDHVRTATVTALTAMVTYRLTREGILKAAANNIEIKQRLEQQRDALLLAETPQ